MLYLSKVWAYRLHRGYVAVGLCEVTGYGELYGGPLVQLSRVAEPIMSLQSHVRPRIVEDIQQWTTVCEHGPFVSTPS